MEDLDLPLPTPEEVLICNCSTTAEEVPFFLFTSYVRIPVTSIIVFKVELFWMRAVSDPEHWRIFSLVHAEKLSYQVSDLALRTLSEHSQEKRGNSLIR